MHFAFLFTFHNVKIIPPKMYLKLGDIIILYFFKQMHSQTHFFNERCALLLSFSFGGLIIPIYVDLVLYHCIGIILSSTENEDIGI